MKGLKIFICLGLAMFLSAWAPLQQIVVIYMIGDSTMANKRDPENNPEKGWGELFSEYFTAGVKIENHAADGRSSKSFRDEGKWDVIMDRLQPGDYVFIQFGHNDQKEKDPRRYTNPYTGYRHNLIRYVKETREKGAIPIILSSMVRRNFNESGTLVDTHGVYPYVAREVAADLGLTFVDMQWLTEEFVTNVGVEASKEYYLWLEPGRSSRFPEGVQDDTHLNEKGARTFAGLVARDLVARQHPLARYIEIRE